MSDLISRSNVISVLEQLEEHSLTGKMDISNVIYLLNNTPTAYDIDKVIRQLNLESVGSRIQVSLGLLRAIEIVKQGGVRNNRKDCKYRHDNGNCLKVGGFCTAVDNKHCEKLKQGAVSDDVCEYETKDDVIYASCNNKSIASVFCWLNECGDYKYCPYCGKKIEMAE